MMRHIARDFFASSELMHLPVLATILFVTLFIAVLVLILRARRDRYDALARLPLDEGEETTNPQHRS
jgi:cbb3-type cytochrome oxidase subunit 3